MTRRTDIWFFLSAALLVVLAVFLVYPLFNIVAGSLGTGHKSGWATLLAEPKYLHAVLNTVVLGIVVTLTTLLLAVPLAYVAARFDFPGKAIVTVLPLITLVIPEVISAQTWLMILGNNGIVTRTLADQGI